MMEEEHVDGLWGKTDPERFGDRAFQGKPVNTVVNEILADEIGELNALFVSVMMFSRK